MFLKLAGLEGSGFRVIEISDCGFRRFPEPSITYKNGGGEETTIMLTGNAFLLNENGDTIETFFIKR